MTTKKTKELVDLSAWIVPAFALKGHNKQRFASAWWKFILRHTHTAPGVIGLGVPHTSTQCKRLMRKRKVT